MLACRPRQTPDQDLRACCHGCAAAARQIRTLGPSLLAPQRTSPGPEQRLLQTSFSMKVHLSLYWTKPGSDMRYLLKRPGAVQHLSPGLSELAAKPANCKQMLYCIDYEKHHQMPVLAVSVQLLTLVVKRFTVVFIYRRHGPQQCGHPRCLPG